MKLIRAKFENYRLLRDLELDFSADTDQKLTVIRAENETGKTTILNALQWALYGDDALPGKGVGHRLSPVDWDVAGSKNVPIAVEIDFEITTVRRPRRGSSTETRNLYRIRRAARETLDGTLHRRSKSTAKLFEFTDRGSSVESESPEGWIQREFPIELRELFFTDGDRALSFIEGTATAERKNRRARVENAIKSLLGLGVIETSLTHIVKTIREFSKEAERFESDEEIQKVITEINTVDTEIESLEKTRDDAKTQSARLDETLVEIERKIEEALIKGDREKLVDDLKQTENELSRLDDQLTEADKAHSKLFEGMALARDLLAPILEKGIGKLDAMHNAGELPRTAVPILEEQLRGKVCICGESLDGQDMGSRTRREHIKQLIADNRRADELQKSLTELYYDSRALQPKGITDSEHWVEQYAAVASRQDELEELRGAPATKLRSLEIQVEATGDTDIQGLRESKPKIMQQRDNFIAKHAECENQLEVLAERRRSLVARHNNLLRHRGRWQQAQAKQAIAADVRSVLEQSYKRITNEELNEVSELMNSLFLQMIGADPEQNAIIRRAEISQEFDILVYGTNNVSLNPDMDLNGASRRALTLAFIMALTKVSQVEGPNVIDTPLGMMSGYVKQSVLRTAIRESSQLILFLTRSEIQDCEEILDAEAGNVITLTNTAHYPIRLANDPGVTEQMVLRCECDHSKECDQCELPASIAEDETMFT